MLREFYGHSWELDPGMIGFVDYVNLFTHLKNKKVAAEKFLRPHFLAIQQASAAKELDNAHWLPGSGHTADG